MNIKNLKFKIPNSLFVGNRKKIVSRMNALGFSCGQIFIQGGDLLPIYDTDMEVPFRQESFFYYLFGYDEESAYGSINLKNGDSFLFVPKSDETREVWIGNPKTPEEYVQEYGVDGCFYIEDIAGVLAKEKLFVPCGKNYSSEIEYPKVEFPNMDLYETNDLLVESKELYSELIQCRIYKSKEELDVFRHVCSISARCHSEMIKQTEVGMAEYDLERIFLNEMMKDGCKFWAYNPIICSGARSCYLHYIRNDGVLQDGDLVLCDVGADYSGFKSDITTTFPANGKFTADQKFIYETVLRCNREVIQRMKEGVNFNEMQRLCERIILERMTEFGILKGNIDEMQKNKIHGCFFPHGLGHFLGLDTHDVKAEPKKNKKKELILEEGMLITVEPGCYFNPVLIKKFLNDPKKKKYFTPKIHEFENFGGVRIEDDVYVTKEGCEVLTKDVPHTVEEIEELMKKKINQ